MSRRASNRGVCRHVTIWKVSGLVITVGVLLLAANGWGNSPLFGSDHHGGQLLPWIPVARPKDEITITEDELAAAEDEAAILRAAPANPPDAPGAPPLAAASGAVLALPLGGLAASAAQGGGGFLEATAQPPSPPPPPPPPTIPPTTVDTPAPAPPSEQKGEPQWIFCAGQWQDCWCGGRIRWGNVGKWKIIDLKGKPEQQIRCSVDVLGDPAWGSSKHCECEVVPGTAFGDSVNPGLLPSNTAKQFTSCEMFKAEAASGTQWAASQWEAVQGFCDPAWDEATAGRRAFSSELMQHLMKSYVDPRFLGVYERYYSETGWVPRAFVNYYAGPPSGKHADMTEHLVWSVHEFSNEPILVFHFGVATPSTWNATRFPRLILVHSSPMPGDSGRSFNFNKMRAMILSKALVGIQLDSDQFVAPNVDNMFKATQREITKDYAMPILPAHFLDRSPRDLGAYWARYCPKNDCKWQSARWGHAHPTWTYWAVPWLGRWLRRNFRDETLPVRQGGSMQALRVLNIPEDEDLLNVGTWEDGGTKQWCKLDLPGPEDFEALLRSSGTATGTRCKWNCGDITSDGRWHPKAVAKVFYTAHHAVQPQVTARYIKALKVKQASGDLPPPILYKGIFYADGDALRAAYPDITCVI